MPLHAGIWAWWWWHCRWPPSIDAAGIEGSALPARVSPLQAAARQQHFEQTPTGRATMKAVKAVKEERAAGRPAGGKDTAADWLT